jgi:beta-N-acetylhexosaminidase
MKIKNFKNLKPSRFFLPLTFAITVISCTTVHTSQEEAKPHNLDGLSIISSLQSQSDWVDSVFRTMTPEERIGQLFMAAAYSNKDAKHVNEILDLIQNYKIGGLIFMQGGPVRQAHLANKYQKASKVPLLLAMDAEWGLAMRLDSTVAYPYQMTMGALRSDTLVYQMGKEVAEHFQRIGMQVNFAPVVDINNNPENPVIGFRSFGENKYNVTEKSYAYMRGLQDYGIIATAKHFPGHGDTNVDSHYGLPIIPFPQTRLDSLELYPFKELIQRGLGGIMTAHLNVPILDTEHNLPSSLSRPIVTKLLKEQLEFKGLIFSDAMNMKGVTKYFPEGIAELRGIIAGNDILEFSENIPIAIQTIKEAIQKGEITQEEIDIKCKRILIAKHWTGLNQWQPIETHNLIEDLNQPKSDSTIQYIADLSITLLKNAHNTIPLKTRSREKIATIAIGPSEVTEFQKALGRNVKADHFFLPKKSTPATILALRKKLAGYSQVIVGIHDIRKSPGKDMGFSKEITQEIRHYANSGKAIFAVFGNPYTITKFPDIEKSNAVILAYQNSYHTQIAGAKLMAGEIGAFGKLPVGINEHFQYGAGILLDNKSLLVQD